MSNRPEPEVVALVTRLKRLLTEERRATARAHRARQAMGSVIGELSARGIGYRKINRLIGTESPSPATLHRLHTASTEIEEGGDEG